MPAGHTDLQCPIHCSALKLPALLFTKLRPQLLQVRFATLLQEQGVVLYQMITARVHPSVDWQKPKCTTEIYEPLPPATNMRTDRQTDRRTDGRTDRQTDKQAQSRVGAELGLGGTGEG
eukprot:COSAG01_NODE_10208_length_2222_cov_1.314178_2_plen_118_part_01